MEEYRFSIHRCEYQKEVEATEEGRNVILEGLGRNIIKMVGNIELENR